MAVEWHEAGGVISMRHDFRPHVTAPVLFAAAWLLAPAHALAAGGAFAVDDAEVGNPGECKVESWASFAGNRDMAAVVSPACVVNLGIPAELGGSIVRARSGDVWVSGGGPKGKINLVPVENGGFGIGLAGAAGWDFSTGQYTGNIVYVPVTFQVRDGFRINVNGGWQYDAVERLSYAYWGAGFEWNLFKPITLIGEVYGLAGSLPPVEAGDPPAPNSIREPRMQVGLRFTPQEKIDIDVIWGRNITGENAHWLTVGVNLRF